MSKVLFTFLFFITMKFPNTTALAFVYYRLHYGLYTPCFHWKNSGVFCGLSVHFSSVFSSYYIYIRSFSKNAFFFFCERAAVGRKTHPFIVTRAKTKKRIFLRGKKMRFLHRAHAQGVRGKQAYVAKGFGCVLRRAPAQGARGKRAYAAKGFGCVSRRAHAQGVRGGRAYAAKGFGCLSRRAHAQGVRRIGAMSRQNEEICLLDPRADGRCPAEHPIRPRGRGGAAIRTPPCKVPCTSRALRAYACARARFSRERAGARYLLAKYSSYCTFRAYACGLNWAYCTNIARA
jgi:hypothetical protein